MADASRIRSPLLDRVLRSARSGLERAEQFLFEAEVRNSRSRLGRGPDEAERMRLAARPCFTMTTGRTGTRTLVALTGASPLVDARHEPEPRMIAASRLAWNAVADDAFWRQAMVVARDPLVGSAFRRGKQYFEGSNRLTFLAGALAEAYPSARFLLLGRRPEAFITSGLKRGYYLGHPWDHARIRPREGSPDCDGWEDRSAEQKCAWLWQATYEHGLALLDRLPASRAMIVRCEDLFAGDLSVVKDVFAFLDVPAPPDSALRSVLRKPLNRQTDVFPWGREPAWTDEQRVSALAGLAPTAQRLGYCDAP